MKPTRPPDRLLDLATLEPIRLPPDLDLAQPSADQVSDVHELAEIVVQNHEARVRAKAAARMAKTRQLRAEGKTPVRVVVTEQDVEVLIANELLDPSVADEKGAIARAITRLLRTLRMLRATSWNE